ncbi:MAG: TSUP family transporter, partial [Acidimicrobiia bacterium]
YVAFALLRPDTRIFDRTARRMAVPVGVAGGALQGATGLAGVVLASYIHALGIPPRAFVFMVTALFSVFAFIQAGTFLVAGAYTTDLVLASLLATAVAMVVLAFGTRLAPRISPVVFHRLVLAVLSLSAVKLIADAVM